MPSEYARRERSKRRFIIAVGAVVAAVLAMVGLARLIEKHTLQKREACSVLAQRFDDLESDRADLAACSTQLQTLSARYTVVRALNRNRRWASCLARIAAAVQPEIVLTRTKVSAAQSKADDSGTAPAASATGGQDAAKEPAADLSKPEKLVLLLEGYALSTTDVTRFISALNDTGLFEQVTFRGSQTAMINAKELNRFELECPLRYTPHARTDKQEPKQLAAAQGAGR
jgi:Tfp pilus assembly protein PilN